MDEDIYHFIINFNDDRNRYSDFFYPEIKEFLPAEKSMEIERNLLAIDENIFDNFDENRHKGVNNSYICTLIRQDLVEEFIAHVNRIKISLASTIMPSIFETNSFLIKKKNPTLIEYSAFYGSIQIFQYLLMNRVKLTPSLWLYTIHSKNAELIHILEYNEVQPPENDYTNCFDESIKCHHNCIAEYIENNLLEINKTHSINTVSYILCYRNYSNFPIDFDTDDEFFYLCKFNYNTLVIS